MFDFGASICFFVEWHFFGLQWSCKYLHRALWKLTLSAIRPSRPRMVFCETRHTRAGLRVI